MMNQTLVGLKVMHRFLKVQRKTRIKKMLLKNKIIVVLKIQRIKYKLYKLL